MSHITKKRFIRFFFFFLEVQAAGLSSFLVHNQTIPSAFGLYILYVNSYPVNNLSRRDETYNDLILTNSFYFTIVSHPSHRSHDVKIVRQPCGSYFSAGTLIKSLRHARMTRFQRRDISGCVLTDAQYASGRTFTSCTSRQDQSDVQCSK